MLETLLAVFNPEVPLQLSFTLPSLTLALMLASSSVFAQAAAPAAPAAPAASGAMMKKAEKPRTAQSIACSGKADAQGLHGRPRKDFMKTCKTGKM